MSGIFQFAVRTQTELEAKMTSVERVTYYINVSTNIRMIIIFRDVFPHCGIVPTHTSIARK